MTNRTEFTAPHLNGRRIGFERSEIDALRWVQEIAKRCIDTHSVNVYPAAIMNLALAGEAVEKLTALIPDNV